MRSLQRISSPTHHSTPLGGCTISVCLSTFFFLPTLLSHPPFLTLLFSPSFLTLFFSPFFSQPPFSHSLSIIIRAFSGKFVVVTFLSITNNSIYFYLFCSSCYFLFTFLTIIQNNYFLQGILLIYTFWMLLSKVVLTCYPVVVIFQISRHYFAY